jgi:inward rectifier potassium channel
MTNPSKKKRKHLASFDLDRVNAPKSRLSDFYHLLMSLSWPKTLGFFFLSFIFMNVGFACLYFIDPIPLRNSNGHFLDCFFFSVQTLGTLGYGFLAPQSLYSNCLVTIESALGMVSIALLAGLFFAKFSLPKARIRFTEKLLVTEYEGKKALVFRMANERQNQVIDSKIHLIWLRQAETVDGIVLRKFKDLKLARAHTPIFAMSMSAIHFIDEESPLRGMSFEALIAAQSEFFVTVIGIDGTSGQSIYATHSYHPEDLVEGGKFKDLIRVEPSGKRVLDFGPFDEVVS